MKHARKHTFFLMICALNASSLSSSPSIQGASMKITKAIIPAAGLGTRFLPFTKAVPKELLPIVNTPAIHYVMKEGIDSGINQFFIITSKGKNALANYFDTAPELEEALRAKKRSHLTAAVNEVIECSHFVYLRQPEPLGLGHAIAMANHLIDEEYVAIMLPDDIQIDSAPTLKQLIDVARKYNASVIGVHEVPQEEISSFGIIKPLKEIEPGILEMESVVEKPATKDAPSNLAISGRYVLHHSLFGSIEAITPESKGEIQLTDAINDMIKKGNKVLAVKMNAKRYDIGRPQGWLKANIDLALKNPEYAAGIKKIIT